jgi:FMN reductase
MRHDSPAMQLTVVYGAPTPPGRLATAVDHVARRLEESGPETVVRRIDLHREPLAPMRTSWSEELDPRNVRAVEAIDGSAAVVFGSPVYRASIPGVLKNLIDHLSVESLRDKPVGLVVVGARPHHYLGVDRHMRDILSWFGALPLPTSVYLTHDDIDDGRVRPQAKAALDELAASLLRFSTHVAGVRLGPAPLAATEGKQ